MAAKWHCHRTQSSCNRSCHQVLQISWIRFLKQDLASKCRSTNKTHYSGKMKSQYKYIHTECVRTFEAIWAVILMTKILRHTQLFSFINKSTGPKLPFVALALLEKVRSFYTRKKRCLWSLSMIYNTFCGDKSVNLAPITSNTTRPNFKFLAQYLSSLRHEDRNVHVNENSIY